MTTLVNVADLINPETGNSYRQDNAALTHKFPLGSLVELVYEDEDSTNGLRLFVVEHNRDCDQTPLYTLSAKPLAKYQAIANGGQSYSRFELWGASENGHPESGLVLIRAPSKSDQQPLAHSASVLRFKTNDRVVYARQSEKDDKRVKKKRTLSIGSTYTILWRCAKPGCYVIRDDNNVPVTVHDDNLDPSLNPIGVPNDSN